MIKNAADTLLTENPGTLPDVSGALNGWLQPMVVKKIVKTIVNFTVVETPTTIQFNGNVQAGTPEQIAMKPEGQRSWKWVSIWCLPSVVLDTDDVVESLGKKYRIKSKTDWSQSGYISYDAIEAYSGDGA